MRILHIFWDVNFINQHDGLTKIMIKAGVRRDKFGPGDMVCFINRAHNRIKIMSFLDNDPDRLGVLAYYRSKTVIDEQAIQYIPQAFDGSNIDYSAALRTTLEKRLPKLVDQPYRTKVTVPPVSKRPDVVIVRRAQQKNKDNVLR